MCCKWIVDILNLVQEVTFKRETMNRTAEYASRRPVQTRLLVIGNADTQTGGRRLSGIVRSCSKITIDPLICFFNANDVCSGGRFVTHRLLDPRVSNFTS